METPSKSKSAFSYGLVLGLILSILSLIMYVFEMYDASWISYISYPILIIGLVMGIKRFRDKECGGFISYGGAVGYGTLIGLFIGITAAVINFVYLGFIDDGFIQFSIDKEEAKLYDQGFSSDVVEQQMQYVTMFIKPWFICLMIIIADVFMALIISLIAAIFLKNENDEFGTEDALVTEAD